MGSLYKFQCWLYYTNTKKRLNDERAGCVTLQRMYTGRSPYSLSCFMYDGWRWNAKKAQKAREHINPQKHYPYSYVFVGNIEYDFYYILNYLDRELHKLEYWYRRK